MKAYLIKREGKNAADVVEEAVAQAEAYLNNVGLPSYNGVLLALEQIKFVLSQEGDASVIAPAYRRCLLDIVAGARV